MGGTTENTGTDDDAPPPPAPRRRSLAVAAAIVGAVALVGVAAAALAQAARGDDEGATPAGQPPYDGPLPPVGAFDGGRPEAVGEVSGIVGTGCRASEHCMGGIPATVDLAEVAAPEEHPPPATVDLSDGRWFEMTPTGGTAPWGERAMPEWWLVEPGGAGRVSLGPGFLAAAAALGDGRIAVVWTPPTTEGTPEVRTLDARATPTPVDLPGGFRPFDVAAGPDGWFAVLGTRDPCCRPHLLVVAPDGAQRRLLLPEAAADGRLQVSWGAAGLIAVSPPFPHHWDERADTGPAVVVDPRAGEVMATFDGWLGTAWSPDGTALLLARRTGAEATRLAVAWGPRLAEHTDLDTVPATFTPHAWSPPTTP